MADYPSAIKTFATIVDLADSVLAAHQNQRGGEITAIETELGTNPAGAYADVATRLNAMASMTHNASTITTANLTCVEGNVYNCTIAGLTANRNAVLPAPSAAGKTIRLNIVDGDATYALIIIGDTGVTINGGSAATEWSRLFIAGETITLESTSTTNWQVIEDGRKACIGVIERQAAQSINSSSGTKIQFDTSLINRGDVTDVATNYRINIRRSGVYQLEGMVSLTNALDDQELIDSWLYIDGTIVRFNKQFVSSTSSDIGMTSNVSRLMSLAAGQYVELYIYHTEGAAQNTNTNYPPSLSMIEVL